MNKSRTACYLVVALLTSSLVGFGQTKPIPTSAKSTTNGQDVKVKAEVEKLGLETNVTVKMLNTKEYHGAIKIIEDDSFTISEVELNQLIAIKYDEARKVSKDYSLRSKC